MNGIAFYFWVCFLALHSLYEAWSWSFLCSGKEASRDRHVGSGGLSVCVSVSTQLRKKFGRHCMRSILHRLFTLVGALAQYMFTHSHGQNTVRNRARLLAWASTLQSFAVRWWLAMTYNMGIRAMNQIKKFLHQTFPGRSIFLLAGLCLYITLISLETNFFGLFVYVLKNFWLNHDIFVVLVSILTLIIFVSVLVWTLRYR